MPQHREVDPKDLGVSPDDEAIQESLKQMKSPAPPPEPKSDESDGDDERDEDEE